METEKSFSITILFISILIIFGIGVGYVIGMEKGFYTTSRLHLKGNEISLPPGIRDVPTTYEDTFALLKAVRDPDSKLIIIKFLTPPKQPANEDNR